jgi:peptidoglycan hydrolase CwlO-like protein
MKKKILLLLIALLCILPFPVFALSGEDIHSNEVLVMDMNSDTLLFEKNTNEEIEHSRYVGRLENMYKESTLEKKRHEIETKIEKIKSLIDPLSKELSDILNQIESSKIDLEIFKNYKNYSLLNNAYHKKKYLRKDSRSNLSFYSNF